MVAISRCAFALLLAVALPATARAQLPTRADVGGRLVERPAFDYFVSSYRGAAGGEGDAVGGRLMWPMARVAPASRWVSRTYLGAYLVHSPDEEDRGESLRYGAQADLQLADRPLVGRVEPLLSLGVGASRVERELRSPLPLVGDQGGWALREEARTLFSVAPGVGFRVLVVPGLGIRGDARQVIDFDETPTRNVELSGGVSIGV